MSGSHKFNIVRTMATIISHRAAKGQKHEEETQDEGRGVSVQRILRSPHGTRTTTCRFFELRNTCLSVFCPGSSPFSLLSSSFLQCDDLVRSLRRNLVARKQIRCPYPCAVLRKPGLSTVRRGSRAPRASACDHDTSHILRERRGSLIRP